MGRIRWLFYNNSQQGNMCLAGSVHIITIFKTMAEEYRLESVVRGYHVYKSVWHPFTGDLLNVGDGFNRKNVLLPLPLPPLPPPLTGDIHLGVLQ